MSNIATEGINLYKSLISGSKVIVSKNNVILFETSLAPGPLLGDVIASDNSGNICIVARVGSGPNADRGYVCSDKSTWKLLGPTAQLQSITFDGTKFICASVGPGGANLIEQDINAILIKATPIPGGTSEGILYYDNIERRFVLAETKPVQVGKFVLFKPIRRLLNGKNIYTGQKVGDPDILFTTDGTDNIAFKSGPQPNYPQFIVIGQSLIVNGGVTYNPPYPTDNEPEPPEPPVPPIPNHKDVVERARAKYNGMPEGNERGYTITNAVAWELRAEGAGTFFKDSGTNYNQRSIDVIIYKHQADDPSGKGKTFDILGDAEGRATPQWARTSPTGFGDDRLWRAPVEPPNPEPIPPDPTNPDRDMLIHIRDEINEFLGDS